jgi:hypothetical protein
MGIAEIAGSMLTVLVLLIAIASRHSHAHTEARIEMIEGVARERWSFSAGYSNTLIGRTLGRAFCAFQAFLYYRDNKQREGLRK